MVHHNTKGAKLLGRNFIYDLRDCPGPNGSTDELIKGTSGTIHFKPGKYCGRELSLELRAVSDVNCIRIRAIEFDIIEVLKKHGYSVGRRRSRLNG